MSRIEEALKRAATAEGPETKPEIAESPRRWPGAAAGSLEHYPREDQPLRRAGSGDVRRPSVVVAPRSGRHGLTIPLDPGVEDKLVISKNVPSVSVEQYLRVAAALDAAQAETGLKTLMVTSALPGDGKTLTIINLALTLSESYQRRVILIDGDLRRPRIQEVFRLPASGGLGDALRSNRLPLSLVEVSDHLSVLPAGRPEANPMSLLASSRMKDVLEEAASQFEWVLLDSPPVGLLSDAQLLARLADGVLFVIRAGSTPYPVVRHAIDEIGAEHIIGTVLNRVDPDAFPVNDYYHSYYLTPK